MIFRTSLNALLLATALAAGTGFSAFAAPGSFRTAFVHLFEWKWNDIAQECESFLGPMGYAAVQVSPPNEHAVLNGQPWYQRYQPVSYQLESRSGNRGEFIGMVRRCKAAGVDVYVDAVINHMAWVNRSGQTRHGSVGSPYNEYQHPGLYQPWDFHRCGRNGDNIGNYQDRWEVQNCNIESCADLKTESDYVRGRLADYLNDLLSVGVSGFRIDAAKHMPASDLQAIFSRLSRPFYAYQEVIDFGSEPIRSDEYFRTGDVTDFRYSRQLARIFYQGKLAWTQNFGEAWGFLPSSKTVVFVDNHDNQRGDGAGGVVVMHRDSNTYVLANVLMLAWPYGYPQVMSSYRFNNRDQGPPAFPNGATKPVWVNGKPQCGNEWVCEHRWTPIANMVAFRNITAGEPVTNWWTNGDNQVAFSRGNKGFVVINRQNQTLQARFQTSLPAGNYCDVLSSAPLTKRVLSFRMEPSKCSGTVVSIDAKGQAEMTIPPQRAMALHVFARLAQ